VASVYCAVELGLRFVLKGLIVQFMQRGMLRWLLSSNWKGMWEEAVVA